LLLMLARRVTKHVYVSEPVRERREKSLRFGAAEAFDPKAVNIVDRLQEVTERRGADVAIVAAAAPTLVEQAIQAVRPGGRILLFAQTSPDETLNVNAASICVQEKTLMGSYSADIDLKGA